MPDGERVQGYRSELRVSPESTTETYAAGELLIDNWRWADVPFYLRTGTNASPAGSRRFAIQFKCAPTMLFRGTRWGGWNRT